MGGIRFVLSPEQELEAKRSFKFRRWRVTVEVPEVMVTRMTGAQRYVPRGNGKPARGFTSKARISDFTRTIQRTDFTKKRRKVEDVLRARSMQELGEMIEAKWPAHGPYSMEQIDIDCFDCEKTFEKIRLTETQNGMVCADCKLARVIWKDPWRDYGGEA